MRQIIKYLSLLMSAVVVFTGIGLLGFFASVPASLPSDGKGAVNAINPKVVLKSLTAPGVSAQGAVLIDASDDTVLMGILANTRLPMASTTKIMTAILALENGDKNKMVAVSDKAIGVEGSSIYLVKGEVILMEDLLHALMLESANDAAAAIAIEIGGSIESFAQMMNDKAKELGLKDTNFTNPHGLDHEDHYTTAYELAKIASYALKNEDFKKITSTLKYVSTSESGYHRYFFNHNRMLRSYSGAVGVKTGYTKRTGRCLVSAAERDGLLLVSVTLNASSDWNDHRNMLDFGFNNYKKIDIIKSNDFKYQIPVVGGISDYINCATVDDVSVRALKDEKNEVGYAVNLKRFCYAPVSKGDVVGEITCTLDGEVVAIVPVVALESVESRKEPGLFDRIRDKIKSWF